MMREERPPVDPLRQHPCKRVLEASIQFPSMSWFVVRCLAGGLAGTDGGAAIGELQEAASSETIPVGAVDARRSDSMTRCIGPTPFDTTGCALGTYSAFCML